MPARKTLAICNIDNSVLDRLPSNFSKPIRAMRLAKRERERPTPGKFPATFVSKMTKML
jgi:hypothetical protein